MELKRKWKQKHKIGVASVEGIGVSAYRGKYIVYRAYSTSYAMTQQQATFQLSRDDDICIENRICMEPTVPQPGYGLNLTAALKILSENNYPVEDLPGSETDPSWKMILDTYEITLP